MSDKRAQWIDKPEQMLRAARHYEKAANYIIQRDVSTAQQVRNGHRPITLPYVQKYHSTSIPISDNIKFIELGKSVKPQLETWVTSNCPARVDLIGAWTDTPPECYEFKGSVIDVSFKLHGQVITFISVTLSVHITLALYI